MSHSDDNRLRNMFETLLIMFRELDGQAIYSREFGPEEEIFKDTFATTWLELENRYFIEPCHRLGADRYRLTANGWMASMEAVWDQNKIQFDEQLGQLMKALKAEVKGRHESGFIQFAEFAAANNLSEDFVFNAIDGNLIEHRLNKHGAQWYEGGRGGFIEIPLNFGQTII